MKLIDNVDVSKCEHFMEGDTFPIIGKVENFCWLNHDLCAFSDCEFKRVSKNDTIEKYKKALEEIRKIINTCFKTNYMSLGFREYDEIIENIDKIVNEVANENNI